MALDGLMDVSAVDDILGRVGASESELHLVLPTLATALTAGEEPRKRHHGMP